ncbi:hypothetical protein MASR1M32_39170 [Rhodobacter sp.]
MSALRDHIKAQAEQASLLRSITNLLNVAIEHPDQRGLCIQLIETAHDVASVLEDNLQDVNLPKGGAE